MGINRPRVVARTGGKINAMKNAPKSLPRYPSMSNPGRGSGGVFFQTNAENQERVIDTVNELCGAIGDDITLAAFEHLRLRIQADILSLKKSFGAIAGTLYRGTSYNRGHPLKLIADNLEMETRDSGGNFIHFNVRQKPAFGSRDKGRKAEFGALYDEGASPFTATPGGQYDSARYVWSSTAFYREFSKNKYPIKNEFAHPGFPALLWKDAFHEKFEERLEEHHQKMLNEYAEAEQRINGKLHYGDLRSPADVRRDTYMNKKGQVRFRGDAATRDAEKYGLTRENQVKYNMRNKDIKTLRGLGRKYRG
tara:strand:+ start:2757 stop:3680 length:924 start_codon:yes stop_codon:yes gene_type:complete